MDNSDTSRSFLVSSRVANAQARDLSLRVSALNERINTILNRIDVDGVPILRLILSVTSEPEALERIGKALLRVAPYIKEHKIYSSQQDVLQMFLDTPDTFAGLLGDFSQEVEPFLRAISPNSE